MMKFLAVCVLLVAVAANAMGKSAAACYVLAKMTIQTHYFVVHVIWNEINALELAQLTI